MIFVSGKATSFEEIQETCNHFRSKHTIPPVLIEGRVIVLLHNVTISLHAGR